MEVTYTLNIGTILHGVLTVAAITASWIRLETQIKLLRRDLNHHVEIDAMKFEAIRGKK
jgi:hypothetical protein